MSNLLPKWLMKNYLRIWIKVRNEKISTLTFSEIANILSNYNKQTISIILSNLNKNGWIEVSLNPNDMRKRIYFFKNPEKILEEIAETL